MPTEPPLTPPHGGTPAPDTAFLPGGATVRLRPLAERIAKRHRKEFPDEKKRYGDVGMEWCVHDNQYLLAWAALSLEELVDFGERVSWLADLLAARKYPVERLARDLEIAAELVDQEEWAAVLSAGAKEVRG